MFMMPSQVRIVLELLGTKYNVFPGRVSTTQPITTYKPGGSTQSQTPRGQYQLKDAILPPEEVLFSRKAAPQRYAEKDIYFANEALPDGGRDVLPDSDMLKAIHAYASRYYEALPERLRGEERRQCFVGSRHIDERSMDETALLAFGILLEEAAREALGKNGDLVFTEGLDPGQEEIEDDDIDVADSSATKQETPVGFEDRDCFWKRRLPKRRKLAQEEE